MKVLLIFFIKYLLAPVLLTVALVVMNNLKSVKSSLNVKKTIVFVLIFGIILALPSLFGLLRNEFVWGGLVLTIFSYLISGICFLWFTGTKLFQSLKIDDSQPLIILVMLMATILGIWIYYLVFEWISHLPFASWAMFSVLWYMLPVFLVISKNYFLQISTPFFKPWKEEDGKFDRSYWDNIDSFNSSSVNVKIKRKHNDKEYASLTVRLTDDISLGNWFNWFVEDQNIRFPQNTIETKIDGENIGWIFYTSKWLKVPMFTRVLNPEKDRAENKIKNNRTIYIRRIKINENVYE